MDCASSYKISSRLGNRHEAAQLQPRQPRDLDSQRLGVLRRHPRLGWAAVDVDLQAHLQRRQMQRALLAEPLRNL